MSRALPSADEMSPDDALPPVEPPSAGFILQLFIVPGVIVVIIVMVWLMFHWLVQQGNDPQAYVAALERNNEARWQAAVNLANALRNERAPDYDALKHDSKLAARLAQILDRELDAGSMEEKPLTLRVFLCRALGEFNVDDGLPVLLKAANLERNDKELEVRRAAIEAIALLSEPGRTQGASSANRERVSATLLSISQEQDPLVRSTAAYALGVVGDDAAVARLRDMLEDVYPDARYNAALGLARHGEISSLAVLVEMLDPQQSAGVDVEKQSESRDFKRAMLVVNALRATRQLSQKNPTADLAALEAAIDKLLAADMNIEVRAQAKETKKQLDERRSTRAARELSARRPRGLVDAAATAPDMPSQRSRQQRAVSSDPFKEFATR